MSINLNHIEITIEPPDDKMDASHSSIELCSTAHTGHPDIAHMGISWGEMLAARVRVSGVLARLCCMAEGSMRLEARDHGCSPTWRGDPFKVDAPWVGCQIWNGNISDTDWSLGPSVSFAVPTHRVDAWLEAILMWLREIHQHDTIDSPDEVIR